jgi:hypothetical protein
LVLGCDNADTSGLDANGDGIADDLGKTIDRDHNGFADEFDVDGDGTVDGAGVDMNGDGVFDGVLLDGDCDGIFDSVDTDGDGAADFVTSRGRVATNVPGCASGSGGSGGSGGSSGSGGSGGSGPSQLGNASYQGTGSSSDRYAESDVYRNGVGYKFMANGWGTGWQSHQISWNGTSFKVVSLNGSQGSDYSPAGYPTVFCGNYSQKQSIGSCGLPAPISGVSAVRTGWRWAANGNTGQYNAAWDIWIGNGTSLSSFLMVWLRDPPGQRPAGASAVAGASVDGLPGTWSIWTGTVSGSGRPIVNYVRTEGQDLSELEFDVLAVYRDAVGRGYALPGSDIMAVAVGFEVWNGPITNLETTDFYVDVN